MATVMMEQQKQQIQQTNILEEQKRIHDISSSVSASSSSSGKHDKYERLEPRYRPGHPSEEENLCKVLGILPLTTNQEKQFVLDERMEEDEEDRRKFANPDAEKCDLSVLRGLGNNQEAATPAKAVKAAVKQLVRPPPQDIVDEYNLACDKEDETDLTALAEIVPGLIDPSTGKICREAPPVTTATEPQHQHHLDKIVEAEETPEQPLDEDICIIRRMESMKANRSDSNEETAARLPYNPQVIAKAQQIVNTQLKNLSEEPRQTKPHPENYISSSSSDDSDDDDQDDHRPQSTFQPMHHPPQNPLTPPTNAQPRTQRKSTTNSVAPTISTHEIRLPMYLPTFKPATGCTNASDFIVRCFVARLRAGITVVKHGRNRWCKSRLRVLHVHTDGRSLTWKPASGEPSSRNKPPKFDLSTCMEVRHAWSPDPLYPMFTGTPILRQKCEAANAHKSFALIFPKRTVDITALTADQCKVLMEGFSALCFRLQVAANSVQKQQIQMKLNRKSEEEEDEVRSTTVSNTLTNNSMDRGSGKKNCEDAKKLSSYNV